MSGPPYLKVVSTGGNELVIKNVLQPNRASTIYLCNQTRHASGRASALHCAPRRVLSFRALGMAK